MKNLLPLSVLMFGLVGCASQQEVGELHRQNEAMAQKLKELQDGVDRNDGQSLVLFKEITSLKSQSRGLDNTKFCYSNGTPYSEGSMLSGQKCHRGDGFTQYVGESRSRQPLQWIDGRN